MGGDSGLPDFREAERVLECVPKAKEIRVLF